MLTFYQTVAGDWRYLVNYDRVMETITAEEIVEVARRYFRTENRTVASLSKEGI